MKSLRTRCLAAVLAALSPTALSAQPAPAPPATPTVPAAPAVPAGVAATVNGVAVAEAAVQRGLKQVPPEDHAKARPDILEYLIDNALIDQYLVAMKVAADPAEVDKHLEEVRGEIKKRGQDVAKVLANMFLTEDELKKEIAAQLRWEKFLTTQATDKALRDLFAATPETFDGSQVRVRHILLTPPAGDPKAVEAAKAELVKIKADLEKQADAVLATLPATADNLAREQARSKKMDELFSKAAQEKSVCPSKKEGGDINWFPRAGSMVEPFAKAAFALKPYQISDVVVTPFGLHLILLTGKKPGQPINYDEAKESVHEVYGHKLREGICAYMRKSAQITVNPPPAK
jgi:peptidyl-prolyl cis-trans isomerase C